MIECDREVVLRALLVDEASRHLATLTVAQGAEQLASYDPARLLEQAYLAAAAGLVLVRGPSGADHKGLTHPEVIRAATLRQLGAAAGIHLLDCFAWHPRWSDPAFPLLRGQGRR